MELTESWRRVLPASVAVRYDIAETRSAAAVMQATTRQAFDDMVRVLDEFELTLDRLTTPGGSKTVIARDLDNAFRRAGWREARYDQDLTTKLTIFRWTEAPEPEKQAERVSRNSYGGHKIDNVLGRAALDVEWNGKDGALDRDLANYVSLYEAGIIDVGVIITRQDAELRSFVRSLIAEVKAVEVDPAYTAWHKRMAKLATDPLGTTTTANFGKLVPRMERGDGRGCPILGIALTVATYSPPAVSLEEEVLRLAEELEGAASR